MNRDSENGQNKTRAAAPKGDRKPRQSSAPRAEHKSDASKLGPKTGKPEFKGEKGAKQEKNFHGGKPAGAKPYRGEKPARQDKPFRSEKPAQEKNFREGKPSQERNFRNDKAAGEKSFRKDNGPRQERGEFRRDGRKSYATKDYDNNRSFGRGEKSHGGERGNTRSDRPQRRDDRRSSYRDLQPESDRMFNMEMRREERWESNYVQLNTARDVALEALREVVRNDAYASQALDRCLSSSNLSQEDRRLAASMFYFSVENRLYIEWALGKLMQNKPEPGVNDIMHVAAAQILFMDRVPDHAAVDEAVKQVRAAKREGLVKLVNGVLRSLIRARDAGELVLPDKDENPEEYISIRYSLALPAVRRLVKAYGLELAEQIAAWQPKERTLTVRANAMQISNQAFEDYLDREGFRWKKGMVKDAYILSGAGSLADTDGYRGGMFSIQGESSMLAAQAVGAKPGMQILDACAAPGGKTCLMAEKMSGSGRVYAWDVHPHRVELIRAAAYRLRLENIRPMEHDACKPMDSLELAMDAVLVDAPCSGMGVFSDKPDIKYKLNDKEFDALIPLQKKILDSCAKNVCVGGRLVYSTCTILPEENEMQVRDFLARHPEFELDKDDSWLPEALKPMLNDGMLQLLPARDGLEGFFIARMRRRAL